MESLFDKIKRTNTERAEYGEPFFSYLNRSNREEAKKARISLDGIYNDFKKDHPIEANDLKQRFRLSADEHHLGALTELYVYRYLKINGYSVTAHPNIPNTPSRPDFVASKNGQDAFIIEAKVVFGKEIDVRTKKFINQILSAINEIDSPEFLISMIIESEDSSTPPKTSKIKKTLQKIISALNYDDVCQKYDDNKEFPNWTHEQGEWRLKFEITPVNDEGRKKRNSDSKNVGATVHAMKEVLLYDNLKKKVSKKVKKYDEQTLPLVIATNIVSQSTLCDENTIMSALFGRIKVTITNYNDGSQSTKTGRTLDGLFKQGFGNTKLSALMVIPGLNGFTFDNSDPILWHHPIPKNALPRNSLNIKQRIHNPETGKIEEL
jgi:hypothetical protein